MHGGNEYNPVPSPRMVKTYRAFAEAGASAVVAMHTHCPQGIEIHNGIPIIYSLGNFLFDIPEPEDSLWWKGYMVNISFNKNKASDLEIIPYTFGPDDSQIRLLKDGEREGFLRYISYLSEIIGDDKELEHFWQGWCAMRGAGLASLP